MMKLDLILLNVTKNVDDEVSVKGSPTLNHANHVSGGGSNATPNNNTSTIVRTLQNLSESIQCYSAGNYLELSSHQGLVAKAMSGLDLQGGQDETLDSDSTSTSSTPSKKQEQQLVSENSSSSRVSGKNNNNNRKKNWSNSTKKSSNVSLTPSLASDEKNMISSHRPLPSPSSSSSSSSSTCLINEDVMATIGKQVLKYLKTSDRYMCLASCLLKSRAFHETYPNRIVRPSTRRSCKVNQFASSPAIMSTPATIVSTTTTPPGQSTLSPLNSIMNDTESVELTHIVSSSTNTDNESSTDEEEQSKPKMQRHPLIQLPRTKHGKPYIPAAIPTTETTTTTSSASSTLSTTQKNSCNSSNGSGSPYTNVEENFFPLSVSHQYPYVGMIRINQNENAITTSLPSSGTSSPVSSPFLSPSTTIKDRQQSTSSSSTKGRTKHRKRGGSIDTKIINKQTINMSRAEATITDSLLVGFDIVVFDDINYRLYDTVQDFVAVFRGMFSPAEFKVLHDSCSDNPETQLRELYLRWAVKEAYTKALGVGLGYDFSTFQVVLDLQGNGPNQFGGNNMNKRGQRNNEYFLWEWLCWLISNQDSKSYSTSSKSSSVHPKVYGVTGTILKTTGKSQSNDHYAFFFCPLSNDERFWPTSSSLTVTPPPTPTTTTTTSTPRLLTTMSGCACACVGPLNVLAPAADLDSYSPPTPASLKNAAIDAMNTIECSVEWTDLEHLISWHSSVDK
jgi:phosphopantetheine--protein transferase-like protein